MWKEPHFIDDSGFYFNFLNMRDHLFDFDPESLDGDRVKENCISCWRHSLEHSKKLEFYKVFKDDLII